MARLFAIRVAEGRTQWLRSARTARIEIPAAALASARREGVAVRKDRKD